MRQLLLTVALICVNSIFSQEPPAKYQSIWTKVHENPEGSKSVAKELNKLREQNPNDPWIHWISGISCNPVIGKEEAETHFRQAIAADSTFPHAYFSLATTIEGSEEAVLREKIDLYTKAVKYDKSLGFAWLYRGQTWMELGQYENAMADAEQARKLIDHDPLAADALVLEVLWKQGKKQEAFALVRKVDFNEGMAIYDTTFDLMLAGIFEEMGDSKGACSCYRRAAEPYEMMEEEIPVDIAKGLKNCK